MITQLAVMGGGSGGGGGGSGGGNSRMNRSGLTLHRSNSSLELPHSPERMGRVIDGQPLRREYGSHGSIDVVAAQCYNPTVSNSTGDNIFVMFQDFKHGRASTDRIYNHSNYHHYHYNNSYSDLNGGLNVGISIDEVCGPTSASSPKLRLKLNRLWGGKETNCSSADTSSSSSSNVYIANDIEEKNKKRGFLHYDTQSLTANLGYAVKLRSMLLSKRRNTATGASAASTIRVPTPDDDTNNGFIDADDTGDGKSNDLVESCPFFRNEIGGEGEREVALTRLPNATVGIHRPSLAYGISILEPQLGETLWKHTCPLKKRLLPIENIDEGALYYRKYFLGKEHQNWFGLDEQLGPIAISIRKDGNFYRIIVRTSELLTLRGSICEDALGLKSSSSNRIPTREILETVAPEVQINCLKLGTSNAEDSLVRLDEQGLSNCYKVGVLYCRSGQQTEEEMYNNQHAGPAFLEFLDTIGQRVRLRGFDGYKAGLDTRSDSTGTHTYNNTHNGANVTLHVVTMLPFTPNNRQQLLRKRHIGNDIVTIVFQEPGALPFSPRRIRSQFQHVFIIVRVLNPCTENTQYVVSVSRSKQVPIFGPPIPPGGTFNKGKTFTDFILAKIINAENAAHQSEKFSTMATRTRQEYLKDLALNYSTTTVIDTGQKFSMLSFSSKRKSSIRPKLACDASQRGAICWQIILEESNQNTDCYLGISIDSIVIIEENTRQIVFVSPCVNVLGWHAQTNSLRLYYHQGECISIHVKCDNSDRDEIMEIVERLRAVTQGSPASELSLRRNSLGQLGFHVQPDGIVTQVENIGLSWQAGLRQGSRLVEICKIAVSTLTHDQMVDLLKTSVQVTVTVIPPSNDGQPRRGCSLQTCQYLSTNYESDYENLATSENIPSQQMAQQPHQIIKNYERSMSPPRSSNSSGYGTGSSSRSFSDSRFIQDNITTNTCSSNNNHGSHNPIINNNNINSNLTTNNNNKNNNNSSNNDNNMDNISNSNNFTGQYYSNECNNYISHRKSNNLTHDNNYQLIEDINQNNNQNDCLNYVKIQRESHNNQMRYGSANCGHKKLSVSTSLPTNQNSNHNVTKLIGNINSRYNDIYEQLNNKQQQQQMNNDATNTSTTATTTSSTATNSYIDDTNYTSIHNNKPKVEYDNFENYVNYNDIKTENLTTGTTTTSAATINVSHDHHKFNEIKNNIYDYFKDNNNGLIDSNNKKCPVDIDNQTDEGISDLNNEQIHDFIIGDKVTCLKSNLSDKIITRKLIHNDYDRLNKDYTSSSLPPEMRIFERDNNEIINDDELLLNTCGGGDNNSQLYELRKPTKRNHNKNHTNVNSNSSSRNQSPRPKQIARNSLRNSSNLTSSTLQEDLMKLINPDYIDDNENVNHSKSDTGSYNDNIKNDNITMSIENIGESNQNNNSNNKIEIQNKCRSRENLCGTSTSTLSVLSSKNQQDDSTNNSEGILMARPATVISNSSTNSSLASVDNKLLNDSRSPRVSKTPLIPLKLPNNLNTIIRDRNVNDDIDNELWTDIPGNCYNESIYDESPSVSDLQTHLSNLELRVSRETRRRISLEDEVRRLRDENRRLQDENHAAAQQLRRFTEWFFQTIDHQ